MDNLETGYSLEGHVEGEPRHLDAPLLSLELAREAEELRAGEQWQTHGHNAKTLVKHPQLRVILMVLRAGARLPEHKAPGELTLQVLVGEVVFTLPAQAVRVGEGGLLVLGEPLPHGVEARKDSVVLLTLS